MMSKSSENQKNTDLLPSFHPGEHLTLVLEKYTLESEKVEY